MQDMSNGRFIGLWRRLPASLQQTLRNLKQKKKNKKLMSNPGFAHKSTSTGAKAAALVGGKQWHIQLLPSSANKGEYMMAGIMAAGRDSRSP